MATSSSRNGLRDGAKPCGRVSGDGNSAGKQRREGNGCGDTVRLSRRGTLRRVRYASPRKAQGTDRCSDAAGGRLGWKRLGPHGRKQGETNLQGRLWSKPSKPGGTAGMEGAFGLAVKCRGSHSRKRGRLGQDTDGSKTVEGRSLENHKRGSSMKWRRVVGSLHPGMRRT